MTADLEKLLAEATPGPWTAYCAGCGDWMITTDSGDLVILDADGHLIEQASSLARQVIELTAENAALRAKAEKVAKTARSILNEAENNGGHIRYSAVLSCRAALTALETP